MASEVAESFDIYKLWAWFETNRKQVTWAAVIIAAAGLIAWFVIWQHDEKQVAASEALTDVSVGQMASPGARPSADGYLRVAAKYPGSGAAARALLMAGGSYFVDGKYSEALAQFEKFRREYRENPLLGEALLGIASCQEAEGKNTDAMATYKDVAEHHRNEPVAPQAQFALARLNEAQNHIEEARRGYEEVAHNDPYGSLGSEAGMRLEELKMKYPTVAAPVPPPTTNAAPFRIEKK
jgi:predicted negative regulator of RcsB-dependent stress response